MRFRLFIRLDGQNEKEEVMDLRGEYHIEFVYQVENLDEFMEENEAETEGFVVSDELGATIAGISYSTARGIILDRTHATYFNGVILPVLNPRDLLANESVL